jgi:hypothetical protein
LRLHGLHLFRVQVFCIQAKFQGFLNGMMRMYGIDF